MVAQSSAKLRLMSAMCIFGTIGLFVKYISLPSSIIAFVRGIVGTFFLLVFIRIKKQPLSREIIKKRLLPLCISGAFIGINWILLFESYRYTSVATATLCYYLAPVFVILAAAVLFKEKLTLKKLLCVIGALVGMLFVSNVLGSGIPAAKEMKGILFGTGAALFYASVILINKTLGDVPAYDKTIVQLFSAAVVILPYCLLTENIAELRPEPVAIVMLIFVGIFHTGIAYALYFGSMGGLSAQTIALFSYVDPIVAIVLSAVLLKEPMSPFNIIGAVLILGSTLISELPEKKKR